MKNRRLKSGCGQRKIPKSGGEEEETLCAFYIPHLVALSSARRTEIKMSTHK